MITELPPVPVAPARVGRVVSPAVAVAVRVCAVASLPTESSSLAAPVAVSVTATVSPVTVGVARVTLKLVTPLEAAALQVGAESPRAATVVPLTVMV